VFKYLPPNQFNMDLCLDCILVMNGIPKVNQEKCPHELFTGMEVDYLRDFRAEWGVVVCCIINGTGVLKVYLIQSHKYACRLQCRCAKAPSWVLESLEEVSRNNMMIGFEEYPEISMPLESNESENVTLELTPNPIMDVNETDEAEIFEELSIEPMVVMQAVDTIEEVLDMADKSKEVSWLK
jgi:hypothetical protein